MRRCVRVPLLASLVLASAAAVPIILNAHAIPAGTNVPLRVSFTAVPSSTTSQPFTVPGQGTINAVGTGIDGLLYLTLPAATTATPVTLSVTSVPQGSDPAVAFNIDCFTVPVVASVTAPALGTAGLSDIVVTLAGSTVRLPTKETDVQVVCNAGVSNPAIMDVYELQALSTFSYKSPVTLSGGGAAPLVLTFRSKAVPATGCPGVDVYVSWNEGFHWHRVTTTPLPVAVVPPIKVASIYPSGLDIRWVQSHNRARITMAAAYATAVDASTYYVNAYDYVGDGDAVAATFLARAVGVDNATLLLCTGGEYKPTGRQMAQSHPGVNVLVMSTLRNVLPALPNLATATGRMYEAIYHSGFIAATVSVTGKLGFIMALDHPTSYAFASAFYLGAKAAADAGLATAQPQVLSWVIGDFNLPWNEVTAARDLLAGGADVLMSVTDNAVLIQAEAHKAGAYSCGFNADDRLTLGDRVLVSALYEWEPIYLTFVRRMVVNGTFGGTFYDGGLGFGVSLTGLSPLVPLTVNRMLAARVAASAAEDALEEVFCGDLVDAATGVTRLNGTTGATSAGLLPAVRGFRGAWCLASADVYSLGWSVRGVDWRGEWVPPPQPVDPAWTLPSSLKGGIPVLPAIAFILVLVFSTMVVVQRRNSVIRYTSPLFLLVCNIGAALYSAVLVSLATSPITDAVCNGQMAGYGLAFALLFGSLFAKTHRVHRLFNNKQLKRLRLTTGYVVRLIGMVLAAEVAVLLVIAFVFPRAAVVERVVNTDGSAFTFERCSAGGMYAYAVDGGTLLSAAHFALLLWGAYLAFTTRSVPGGFNESRWIGLSIYNVIVCELVGFILVPSAGTDPRAQYTSAIVRLGVPPVATLLLLYVPKAYALWQDIADADVGQPVASGGYDGGSGSGMGQLPPRDAHGVQVAPLPPQLAGNSPALDSPSAGYAAGKGGSLLTPANGAARGKATGSTDHPVAVRTDARPGGPAGQGESDPFSSDSMAMAQATVEATALSGMGTVGTSAPMRTLGAEDQQDHE